MKMKALSSMAVVVALACITQAQPVMDGTADEVYGASLSTQNTNTQFGNGTNGDAINPGGGSEIDQVFATVADGRLYIMVAGNLEMNFNKLEVFIDSAPGGVNTLDGANLPPAVDGFCCGGLETTDGALQRMSGLTFDSGFDADYYLTFTHGAEKVRPDLPGELEFWAMTAHYADLTQGSAGANVRAGMQLAQRGLPNVLRFLGMSETLADFPYVPFSFPPTSDEALGVPLNGTLEQGDLIDQVYAFTEGGVIDDAGTGALPAEIEFTLPVDETNDPDNLWNHRDMDNTIDLQMALDNSNTVGVTGDGPYEEPTTENPGEVITGIEFSIPLENIGIPDLRGSNGEIRITAFINGTGHDFASNQFSGVGVLTGNLAGDFANMNLADIAGDQFVTVVSAQFDEADFDRDGDVDGDDFLLWQTGFGTTSGAEKMDGDYDNDGDVDGDDFLGWQDEFGNSGGDGASAVPEPASGLLMLLGGLLTWFAADVGRRPFQRPGRSERPSRSQSITCSHRVRNVAITFHVMS